MRLLPPRWAKLILPAAEMLNGGGPISFSLFDAFGESPIALEHPRAVECLDSAFWTYGDHGSPAFAGRQRIDALENRGQRCYGILAGDPDGRRREAPNRFFCLWRLSRRSSVLAWSVARLGCIRSASGT